MTDDIVSLLKERMGQCCTAMTPPRTFCPDCALDRDVINEIRKLRSSLLDCDDDFHALKKMFDKMRDDRDRWRKIAEQLFLWLHPSPEDDSVYEAGVEAMTMYEEAARGE